MLCAFKSANIQMAQNTDGCNNRTLVPNPWEGIILVGKGGRKQRMTSRRRRDSVTGAMGTLLPPPKKVQFRDRWLWRKNYGVTKRQHGLDDPSSNKGTLCNSWQIVIVSASISCEHSAQLPNVCGNVGKGGREATGFNGPGLRGNCTPPHGCCCRPALRPSPSSNGPSRHWSGFCHVEARLPA